MLSGVGEPLSPERTRMLLALRINVLAKGHSGIKLGTLQQYVDAFNGKLMTMYGCLVMGAWCMKRAM